MRALHAARLCRRHVPLTLFYLSAIPTTGAPQPGAEGAYLIVSKNLIELAAVLVVFAFRTGTHRRPRCPQIVTSSDGHGLLRTLIRISVFSSTSCLRGHSVVARKGHHHECTVPSSVRATGRYAGS